MIPIFPTSIIYWAMKITFVTVMLWLWFWLLLVASWSLNPRFIPKIQIRFLDFIYRIVWYSRAIVAYTFPLLKLGYGPRGCHKIIPTTQSNCHNNKHVNMELVAQLLSLPTRPSRSFYFFAGFVFPLLPLDLTGNNSESWKRIYACFAHILKREKIILRSEQITHTYAIKFARELLLHQEQYLKVSDERLRYIICAIMWELVFGSEPLESDLQTITELVQSMSTAFTYNTDPDWSKRIDLCRSFMEQIRCHPEVFILQRSFHLTPQEMCTVVAMELFITPALEISEVMSNLVTALTSNGTNLIREVSCDSDIMRYAIMVVAHHYPVLQATFREISSIEDHQNLTSCSNLFDDIHVVEIEASYITEPIKSELIIDNINRYILNRNNPESSISEINTCMAFGKGQRICKGKELAIKIITVFLTSFYTELDRWPNVEISAGRKFAAFCSLDHRLYHWYRRCWIADVHYYFDKLFRKTNLERFQCEL